MVAENNLVAAKISQVRKEGGLIQEYLFHFKGNSVEPQWVHRNAVGALRHSSGVRLAREWRDNGGENPPQITKAAQFSSSNHGRSNIVTTEVPRQTDTCVANKIDQPIHKPATPIQPGPMAKINNPTTKPLRPTTHPTTTPQRSLTAQTRPSFDIEKVAQSWNPSTTPHPRPPPPTLNDVEMERMRALHRMELQRLQTTIVSFESFGLSSITEKCVKLFNITFLYSLVISRTHLSDLTIVLLVIAFII